MIGPRDVTCDMGSLVVTGHLIVGATRSHLGDLMVFYPSPSGGTHAIHYVTT